MQPLEPEFIHKGHMNDTTKSENHRVVTHLVHPTLPGLYLAAATDGSLHAWQHAKQEDIT